MKNLEVNPQEVNKLDALKKELDFVELEERLEMVQILAAAPCCSGCGGDGSCNGSCDTVKK